VKAGNETEGTSLQMVAVDNKQVVASKSYFTIETELLRDEEYQKLAARIIGVVDLTDGIENVVAIPMFGLPNPKLNCCWMNTTLQILFRIGDINQMLSKDAPGSSDSPLYDLLHKLYHESISQNTVSVQDTVLELLWFCDKHMELPFRTQLDPAEFFQNIIKQLHLDFRQPYISKSNYSILMSDDMQAKHAMARRDWNEYMMSERISPLMETFYFQIMRTYTCRTKNCGGISVDFDIDNVLTVQAPEKQIPKKGQSFQPPTILSLLQQKFGDEHLS